MRQMNLEIIYEKMYKIELLEGTKNDLNLITDYIYRCTFNIDIVDKIYKEIVSSIYSLQIFPYRFIEVNNYRIITIKWKYKVFYKVDEVDKIVTIYRIFSSLQNYDSLYKN